MQRYGTNADGQMERDGVARLLQDLSGGAVPDEEDVERVMAEARAMPLSTGISAPELIKVLSLWSSRNGVHGDSDACASLADGGYDGLGFKLHRPVAPEPIPIRPQRRCNSDIDGCGATVDGGVSAFGCASATCAVS